MEVAVGGNECVQGRGRFLVVAHVSQPVQLLELGIGDPAGCERNGSAIDDGTGIEQLIHVADRERSNLIPASRNRSHKSFQAKPPKCLAYWRLAYRKALGD